MRFSLFCGITKPKLRKSGANSSALTFFARRRSPRRSRSAERGGKTGPQPSVPAVLRRRAAAGATSRRGSVRRWGAACATALFVGPAKPGGSLRSARRRSVSEVAGLRRGCGPRGSIEPQIIPIEPSDGAFAKVRATDFKKPQTHAEFTAESSSPPDDPCTPSCSPHSEPPVPAGRRLLSGGVRPHS